MQAVTARLSAAHAARDITLIANITREKAALAKEREAAARWSTLSEEDTRALPGKMRDLEDRLFDLSLQLTQAPECDVDMLDQVAELQRSVREALETLAPAPTTPTSTAEHGTAADVRFNFI